MADVGSSFFKAASIAIITGASRGIGRAIALEFAKRSEDLLHLVLTGRSEEDLRETFSFIKCTDIYSPENTTVKIVVGDLGKEVDFPTLAEELFGDIDCSTYQYAMLVNNAGTTGDITKFTRDFSASDSSEIQNYFFMNVTTTLLLASKFLSTFPSRNPNEGTGGHIKRTIVQITSSAAVVADASWSLYSTGKAARNMLHKVIAVEEPDVRVLSYNPGPVDTAMFHYAKELFASPSTNKKMTEFTKNMVTPAETAGVLCDVLNQDTYESGAYVSIFDIINQREDK